MKLIKIFLMLFLASCTYKPVIDTSGRSGTFDYSKSDEITNDLQHWKYKIRFSEKSYE